MATPIRSTAFKDILLWFGWQKIDINAAKEKIEQYCKRVRVNLDKCTLQDKKKALNALDIEIVAMPQEMKIRIAVPLEFITTAQTWA